MSATTEFFEILTESNSIAAAVRLVLAALCGGLIGLERGRRRRPAGFRTHMLVCMGAALTMIIGQYIAMRMQIVPEFAGKTTDISRLGAQVINGIGFLGAGTIIVTDRQEVKGLTTAAGLWVSAIIGLAIGIGYYEAALAAMVIVLIAEILLSKLEWHISSKAQKLILYIEYNEDESIGEIAEEIKKMGVGIMDIEITRSKEAEGVMMNAIFALQLERRTKRQQLLLEIQEIKGVISIEEL